MAQAVNLPAYFLNPKHSPKRKYMDERDLQPFPQSNVTKSRQAMVPFPPLGPNCFAVVSEEKVSSVWKLREVELQRRTVVNNVVTLVEILGAWEPNGYYEVFVPALSFPRGLKLNQPSVQTGKIVSPSGVTPFVFTLMVTQQNLKVTVKAGTYSKCIRMNDTMTTPNGTDSTSAVMARDPQTGYGLGEIRCVWSELQNIPPAVWAGLDEMTSLK